MKTDDMITVVKLQRHRTERTPQWIEVETKANEVMQAYRDVITQYPQTEIAGYCVMRLGGFHEQFGDFDRAAKLMEEAAGEFAETYQGMQLIFSLGLVHAQGKNDHAEARNWFARVRRPNESDPSYGEAIVLYMSAQEQLVKCELKLGEDRQAKQRVNQVKQDLPKFAAEVDRFYQFELASQPAKPADITKKASRRSSVWLTSQIVFLALVLLVTIVLVRKSNSGAK